MGIINNPILPGFNPDPSITYVPNVGYVVCTSSFEFWPALPIYHSNDLVSWKLVGHALARRDQGVDLRNSENSSGLWAPTIRYHKGRVYVACTSINRFQPPFAMGEVYMSRSFYVWTENILDEKLWSSAVFVDEPGIDPDLFFDDDDRVYLTTSRRIRHADTKLPFDIGLYVAEIDLKTGRSISPSILIRCSDIEKERSGTVEGSHIHKHDGKYYLFAAEGGTETGHCATISRSDNVFGPYEQPPPGVNPIVYNEGDHPDVQSVGHMDIIPVQGSDVWLAVFLGVQPTRPSGGERPEWSTTGHLGRETFAAGMVWTESGWPQVNHGRSIELRSEYQGVPSTVRDIADWQDTFQGSDLGRHWYTIRTPLRPFWSLDPATGLSIYGNVHRLDGYQENPACLLIRQKDRLVDFTADMSRFVDVEHAGQEAGVALYMAKSSHASLTIRLIRDSRGQPVRQLVFRKPDGSSGDTEKLLEGFDAVNASNTVMRAKIGEVADFRPFKETVVDLGPELAVSKQMRFAIRARDSAYEFAYCKPDQDHLTVVGQLPIEKLNPLFTGAHLGVFAQGDDGRPVIGAAVFRRVEYRVLDS